MIRFEKQREFVVGLIEGDIDMTNTATIEDNVGHAVGSGEKGFVLEMSGVTYLDSAGIRLLYHLDERAAARQQKLLIVVPSDSLINRTLEAAGALGSLRIVTTLDDALDVLSK